MRTQPGNSLGADDFRAEAERRIALLSAARARAAADRGHVPEDVVRALDDLRGTVRRTIRLGEPHQLAHDSARVLAQLDSERHDAAEEVLLARIQSLAQIHGAMRSLREVTSSYDVLAAVPGAVLRACGFARAMLSRVDGRTWMPIAVAATEQIAHDRRITLGDTPIKLQHESVEALVVRRRDSVISSAAPRDTSVSHVLRTASGTDAYAVSPVVVGDRVLGLLHADRHGQSQGLTPADCHSLASFAEHFSLLYERAVLIKRLETQRASLRDALTRAQSEIDELCTADIALVREERPAVKSVQQLEELGPRGSLTTLLTAREIEVLDAMATGASNSDIAEQLTISVGTVKSHVKRILRKLQARSRSEAVARYMHFQLRQRERERERVAR